MDVPTEHNPASVPTQGAKQAGETPARWAWVEPSVWTDRMLTALENGVRGGQWYSLMDKVYATRNLESAAFQVLSKQGAAGVDHQTVSMYKANLEGNLARLAAQLRTGTYCPQMVKRVMIPKPGSTEKRPLGIPTVQDRVVQAALRHVLEPIFERDFAEHSYGFRPGRGCQEALSRVEALLKAGHQYVLDVDLKSYFDTIPHERLLEQVKAKVADGRALELLEKFLNQGVMDGLSSWTPTQGTPQGAVISPLLSNIYLNPLDHLMAERKFEMVRYADDFVILCRSPEEAQRALEVVQTWVKEAGLTLHPTKTRVVDAVTEGFEFLGYRFINGTQVPRAKSLAKLKETVRSKTPRTRGNSLHSTITGLNLTLKGWFGYFKRSNSTPFPRLDGWIRMRLRSILRKRAGRRGAGRGADHQRWPNDFFEELGLFNLTKAHATYRQSALR
jgi:RNA-directed DNA polymerase